MIRHACPNCHETMLNSPAAAGMEVRCGCCHTTVVVPVEDQGLVSDFEAALARAQADGLIESYSRIEDDESKRSIWEWLMLGLLPVIVAGIAWLLAGNVLWLWVSIVGGVVSVGFGLGVLRILMDGDRLNLRSLAMPGYFGLIVAIWIFFGYWFQTGTVYVDNYSRHNLRVLVDGEEWTSIRSSSQRVRSIGAGSHRVVVLDKNGKQLDAFDVVVERKKTYVMNLLRAQTYFRGSQRYGGSVFGYGDKPSEEKIKEVWFEAEVDYLFETPPSSITVSVRKDMASFASESRSYLRRAK